MSFSWKGTVLLTTCLLQCKVLIWGSIVFDQGTEGVRIFSRKDMIKLGHCESLLGKETAVFCIIGTILSVKECDPGGHQAVACDS